MILFDNILLVKHENVHNVRDGRKSTQQLRLNSKIILFIIGERITLKCSRSFIASRSALKIIISVRPTPSTKHIISKK